MCVSNRSLTDVILTQGVSLRTNLNIDSTKLAGVDSWHFSSDLTTQICNKSISLKRNYNMRWFWSHFLSISFHFVSLFRKREADGSRVSRLYLIKMLKSSKTLFLWALRLVWWIFFGAMKNDETHGILTAAA